jgi:hypothetical protein
MGRSWLEKKQPGFRVIARLSIAMLQVFFVRVR